MYDYIVIGLGCSGISTLKNLSEDNNDVLGIDMYGVPNDMGSSHGTSRIYRMSYYEGSKYLSLLKDSYNKWKGLEKYVGTQLLLENGFLFLSDEDEKFEACLSSCEKQGIEYDIFSRKDINKNFKEWNIKKSGVRGVYHKYGGLLRSKKVLEAFRDVSLENGANLSRNEVVDVISKKNKVKVECENTSFMAKGVVIATGPWIKSQFDFLGDILDIERHLYCKYDGVFNRSSHSWISFIENNHFYGLSSLDSDCDFKVGRVGEESNFENMNKFYQDDIKSNFDNNKNFASNFISDSKFKEYSFCPITRTRDDDFIIDYHPDTDRIVLCCGMSGHGFKLSNINGKIAYDLITGNDNKYQDMFSLDRF